MRQIQKRHEPHRLTQFRAAYQSDPNFNYDLIDASLRKEIRQALMAEQRGLCAYTGRRIDEDSCHIEHLKPQKHCLKGEDVSYSNMVACVPAPNAPDLPYGARKKNSWPDPKIPAQAALFVSPLQEGCEERFSFTLNGEIGASNPEDRSAKETISHLRLCHDQLTQLRKAAIDNTLGVHGKGPASLDLSAARRRLAGLVRAESNTDPLEPFCFVLKQALEKHIKRLEAIRRNKKEQL